MTKLREMAKEVPSCMGCGLENPNGDLLCLAHSNALQDGRGSFFKSNDLYGAYLCSTCHDMVDGRRFAMSKEEKRGMHEEAWRRTVRWWIDNGKVKPT